MSKDDEGRIRIRSGDEELYLAPSSESEARAAALLPTRPSEDASRVLGKLQIPAPDLVDENDRDYLPTEEVEWVVTVQFAGEPHLEASRVAELFDKKWREQFGGLTIYGLDAETGRWTFLVSADGPAAVTRLKFSWDYVDPINDDAPIAEAPFFERRLHELNRKLAAFGAATSTASLSPQGAAKRANELAGLKSKLDYTAVLILKAPGQSRFEGKAIWDVMLCVGLTWGDMDCFHWVNPSGVGDDYHFSVETSTPPGYFLPERIAVGQVQVEDLVFAYSVPRCAKPTEVFDAMARAVEYCRKRLGGEIQDEHRRAANLVELRSKIVDIEQQLRDADLAPGSDSALRLF